MVGADRSVSKLSTLENRDCVTESLLDTGLTSVVPEGDGLAAASAVSLQVVRASMGRASTCIMVPAQAAEV